MPLDCERKPRQLEGEVTARMWSCAVLTSVLPWHPCRCHCITALLPANFLIYHPIPIINIFVRSDGFRAYLLNLIYIIFEFYDWNVFILDGGEWKRTVPLEVVQAKVQEWLECIIINNTKSISYTNMKVSWGDKVLQSVIKYWYTQALRTAVNQNWNWRNKKLKSRKAEARSKELDENPESQL